MKPNLYVCGDSFVDWDLPEMHWTDYLGNHYNVIKLGKKASDNNSILYQTGRIEDYKIGDRLVIIFSIPNRFPERYYGVREVNQNNKWFNWQWYKNKSFAKQLVELRVSEMENWHNGVRNDEILFLKKLNKFYSEYNPVIVTWNKDFHKLTYDFVELIEVSSISDEGGDPIDWHPGWKGCYDFYLKIHSLLKCEEKTVDYIPHNKINRLI